jgi:transcriptional regulator with XRE-family HTH domain
MAEPTRGVKGREARRAEVARLRALGLSVPEMARRLGVSAPSVYTMLRRLGRADRLPVACRECGAVILAALPAGVSKPPSALCLACLRKLPDAPFAERLRSYRLAAGLTRVQVGAKVGVTASMITHYETGRCAPSPEVLARLVTALGPGLLGQAGGKEECEGAEGK